MLKGGKSYSEAEDCLTSALKIFEQQSVGSAAIKDDIMQKLAAIEEWKAQAGNKNHGHK